MDSQARRSPRAFTLIELLVVVGIIAILISVSLAVGLRVAGSGKARQTEQTLNTLEAVLTEYISASGGNPKPYVLDPRPENMAPNQAPQNRRVQPVFDGRNGADNQHINSVGFFIAQCREFPSVMERLGSLPASVAREYDADAEASGTNYTNQPRMLTVFDGWGNPIRYVHPAFSGTRHAQNNPQGYLQITHDTLMGNQPTTINGIVYQPDRWGIVQVRRNNAPAAGEAGDSDGGTPAGARPYFYSAGPDGDPSTTDDNVYHGSNRPRLPRS
jgi:prepilin-type N-terminal cleavage/methylation domain-containing protein